MSYYTRTFSVGAHWFGVPFQKLQTFSGIFWVLPSDYSLYEKTILGSFVYLFICQVTVTKVNIHFLKLCTEAATRLISEWAIFAQNTSIVFSSIIPLYIETNPDEKLCKVREMKLKKAHTCRAKIRFRENQNFNFCIIFNIISFVNAQGSVKIRLACQKVLILINYFDRKFWNTFRLHVSFQSGLKLIQGWIQLYLCSKLSSWLHAEISWDFNPNVSSTLS